MLRRLIPLLLLPLFGCASNPATQSPTASPVRQEQKQSAIPAAASTLPPVELTADLLLRFLAGDIAVQRGQTDLGAAAWLDIAQSTRDPRTAKRATELAVSSAQLNLALEASKLWIDSTPSDQDAQRIQLSLLIRANRLKDVEPLLVQTKIDDTEAWRSFFIQLHLLWASKADPAEVRRLTLLLCQGHERLPEARFALATLHATQNREKQALSELDAALGLRPWWEPAVLYKGQLLQQSGQNKSAISLLNQAARHNPTQRSFALALARLLHADQQSAAAQTVYTEFLAQRPNDSEALLGAAEIALQSNDYNSAYDLLLRVSALPSTNQSLLYLQLAFIEEQRGHTLEALQWYQRVEGKDQYRAQLQIPRLYAELQQRDAAFKALSALQPSTPEESIDKVRTEAQVLRLFKEYQKGLALLNQTIKAHPNELELYYDRSLFADLLGNTQAAEADLRFLTSKEPENSVYLNALGYILADRTKQLAEAEALLKKAIAKDPDNPTIIDSVGWLYYRQGKLALAQTWLARAYGLLPDPEVAAHYAEVLWKNGDHAQARQILEEALKKSPANDELLETRQRLGIK